MVEILPSTPRQPKPPGTKIPSTSLYTSAKSVPSASTASESTHLMFTFVSSTIPAWPNASATEIYASCNATYLPTRAMVISCLGCKIL